MVFRSHPIGACCMLSGRLQGFIHQKLAHFEEHILMLHTERCGVHASQAQLGAKYSNSKARPRKLQHDNGHLAW
jgi:hypothetical protein